MEASQVSLLSHSAGGILASRLAPEDAVSRLVCIGYPFKNPNGADESFRTAHLSNFAKPFLILQGDRDEYGTAEDARQYGLSSSTTVIPLAADHGYSSLGPNEIQACCDLVLRWTG